MEQTDQSKRRRYSLLFFRGMAMGAADVVPGVSGGTIAFITGIYEELVESLRRCDHRAITLLYRDGVAAAWAHINGSFLVTLFAGVLFSILSLAKVVTYCLEAWPIQVWSFFFGLVLAASIHLFRQIPAWNPVRGLLCVAGVAAALLISQIKPAELPDDWWVLMAAGAVAICAMILPGVSGGFLLLVMGLYPTIIQAVSELNVPLLSVFAVGCGLGLLSFSHILGWLLQRFHDATMALLTGFLLGSLLMLWPWRITLESVIDRHGEVRPLVQEVVSPWQFEAVTGAASYWMSATVLFMVGLLLVLCLEGTLAEKETGAERDSGA